MTWQRALIVIAAASLSAGCRDIASPEPVALQFHGGVSTIGVPALTITESPPGLIRVVGGYADGACGPIGAKATRDGSTIRLEIGPRSGECDLIRLGYAYEAAVVGLSAGEYHVRVFHRPSAGPPELALESRLTVH